MRTPLFKMFDPLLPFVLKGRVVYKPFHFQGDEIYTKNIYSEREVTLESCLERCFYTALLLKPQFIFIIRC